MNRRTFHAGSSIAFLLIVWLGVLLAPTISFGQQLPSGVNNLFRNASGRNSLPPILNGVTRDLAKFEVYNFSGQIKRTSCNSNDDERLIIILDGKVSLTLNHQSRVVGQGSIAWVAAGTPFDMANADSIPASYYVLKFRARSPLDKERGNKSGSFIIDWNDVVAKPTDKGMRREFFDLPTGMFERFEMHVTTLNKKDEISHLPHTHRAEEIVLLLNGHVEMQIGEKFAEADPGAIIFLASESSHALKNIGDEPCTYFAFQWQDKK